MKQRGYPASSMEFLGNQTLPTFQSFLTPQDALRGLAFFFITLLAFECITCSAPSVMVFYRCLRNKSDGLQISENNNSDGFCYRCLQIIIKVMVCINKSDGFSFPAFFQNQLNQNYTGCA